MDFLPWREGLMPVRSGPKGEGRGLVSSVDAGGWEGKVI